MAGTTGEGNLLELKEKLELFQYVSSKYYPELLIILNVGTASTIETINLIKKIEMSQIQCDAYMVVIPYYVLASFNGIEKHYLKISEVSSKPIIIYDIPKRTGVKLKKEELLKLLKIEKVIGIKEASDDLELIKYLIDESNKNVYIGRDEDYFWGFRHGADGIISVMSNENITLLNSPNDHREEIDAIIKYLKKYPNPYGIKKHMNENNFKVGMPRPPLDEA